MPRTALSLLLAIALATVALPASADPCKPDNGLSSCIDANALWMAPEGGRFVAIPAARTLPAGRFTFGVGASYLSHPIVLDAPSPDPDGREIRVVDDAVDATLLWAYGATHRLELGAALPMVLYQTGAGIAGLTSQSAPPIARSAARDPRIDAAYALIDRKLDATSRVAAKARLALGLPFGDQQSFAGDRSFVLAPSLVSSIALGRFYASGSVGLRLRQTAELAGARLGSELWSALGAGVEILPRRLLSFSAEAWALPTLASQDHTLPDRTHIRNGVLAPAEWLASFGSSPLSSGELTFQAGGGMAIPLSGDQRVAPGGTTSTEHFAGITTPRFRVVFVVRYVPRSDGTH
jgi:hypothetical protein